MRERRGEGDGGEEGEEDGGALHFGWLLDWVSCELMKIEEGSYSASEVRVMLPSPLTLTTSRLYTRSQPSSSISQTSVFELPCLKF